MPRIHQPDTRKMLRRRAKMSAYSVYLATRQLDQLGTIRDTLGIPVSEQIRRGVDLWLKEMEKL